MYCYLPFLAPCSTSFPTSQMPSMGFFTINRHSGSFRRLVCSTPSSSWLLSADSSGNCPHASKIGTGSAPPELLESKLSWARVSFCPSCSDRFASSTFICNFIAILPWYCPIFLGRPLEETFSSILSIENVCNPLIAGSFLSEQYLRYWLEHCLCVFLHILDRHSLYPDKDW